MEEEKKHVGRPKGIKDKTPRKKRDPKTTGYYKVMAEDTPVGCATLKVSFIRKIRPTAPIDLSDVAEMRRRFDHYLEVCEETDTKISNQAAYFAIGVTREQVHHFTRRRSVNPERADFLEEVKQICGVYREQLMLDGEVRDAIGIFHQKNYDGFKDQQEHVIVAKDPLGEAADMSELEQKYLESANLGDAKTIETTMQESIPVALPEAKKEET